MRTERDKAKVKYTDAYQTYHSAGDEAEAMCSECEAILSDEYTYCPWCGGELDWEPKTPKANEDIPIDEFPFYTAHEDSEMTIDELIYFLREAPDHCWTRESELRMADEVERLRKENERLWKWTMQGDVPLSQQEENEISDWLYKKRHKEESAVAKR